MSRIHDALKRAGQERMPNQLEQLNQAAAAQPFMPSMSPSIVAGGTLAPMAVNEGSSLAGAFSPDEVLARCPKMEWQPDPRSMLVFSADQRSPTAEQFRTLRSRLYQMRQKTSLKRVLVTSALPKEGKSFIAANLAQVIVRQHGRRVLLIDADLRRPRLHSVLGTAAKPGISDYLQGNMDEFSVMQQGSLENLFFIPGGQNVSNPAELVANGRLGTLLERVQSLFDWIIVDSSPAVPVSDASLIASHCDGVLMVVRAGLTSLEAAKKARQEFHDKAVLGVVLNGADVDFSYRAYYAEMYESGSPSKG